jgi:hypothetical protein
MLSNMEHHLITATLLVTHSMTGFVGIDHDGEPQDC